MIICKVWDSDYPWDVRVEKLCNSLLQRGNEVHLVCRNRKQREPYEVFNGLHIHRLPKLTAKLGGVLGFPFFLNPIWIAFILGVVVKYKVDAIIVRDLPMALAAVIVAKLFDLPCFLDMAEPYPEMLLGYHQLLWRGGKRNLINRVVRNPTFAQLTEKVACRYLSHIFPVSLEMKGNLIAKGIDEDKITVFHNTPAKSNYEAPMQTQRPAKDRKRGIDIVYVGDITEARGLPIVINAIDRLRGMNERFRLNIIGSGRHEEHLRRLVNEKNLDQNVLFSGWIPRDRLSDHLLEMDIGIIPHLKTKHNELTLPNKVFDYMELGLPIVSACLAPIKRILAESQAGLVFEPYTVEALCESLLELKDEELRLRMGKSGRQAVERVYNWEWDFQRFLEVFNRSMAENIKRERIH